jgi:hypothetical protein
LKPCEQLLLGLLATKVVGFWPVWGNRVELYPQAKRDALKHKTMPIDKEAAKQTYKSNIRLNLTITKKTFHLIDEVMNKTHCNTHQEVIRAALNYYFLAHGYKTA